MFAGYKRGETLRLHDALLRTAPGQQVPVALSCAPLPTEQHAMVVTVLDMSVVRHLHQQLEFQAVTDPLTGLLNRRGFYQTVEKSAAARRTLRQHLGAVVPGPRRLQAGQ
ncbi:hypothetical protein ACFS4T_32195 [Pseudomonas lini]